VPTNAPVLLSRLPTTGRIPVPRQEMGGASREVSRGCATSGSAPRTDRRRPRRRWRRFQGSPWRPLASEAASQLVTVTMVWSAVASRDGSPPEEAIRTSRGHDCSTPEACRRPPDEPGTPSHRIAPYRLRRKPQSSRRPARRIASNSVGARELKESWTTSPANGPRPPPASLRP
jgi:hypothetical protein